MNEPPPISSPKRTWTIVAIVGGVLLLLIGLAVGIKVGRAGVRTLMNLRSAPPRFPEAAWAPRTLQDVTVTAPFDFGPGPDISDKLPQQIRGAISYMQIYQNTGAPKTFVVMVSRIEYKPGIQTSLDGAVAGAMKNMGAAIGDTDPKYSITSTSVSGLEGRRVSYKREKSGPTVNVDSVFARQGQKLWQIQVLYQYAESAGDVSRIIKSVKITP